MRVLVIEDDEAIRSVLDRGLRAEGFDVDLCSDGPSGLWKALEGGHAAIVLDLLLPGLSGYLVCEKLRAEGVTTPILVLSAKSGDYDQIDLLDSGADDFLDQAGKHRPGLGSPEGAHSTRRDDVEQPHRTRRAALRPGGEVMHGR